jgi:hypothetical protein
LEYFLYKKEVGTNQNQTERIESQRINNADTNERELSINYQDQTINEKDVREISNNYQSQIVNEI